MRFCIITHVVHKFATEKYFAYGPYVREMNLWLQKGFDLVVVAPLDPFAKPTEIDQCYNLEQVHFIAINEFSLTSLIEIYRTAIFLPSIIFRINKGMGIADHIHLRCPGNVGLIGCFVQIFFPKKIKTAKYAGNWDWNSKQPWSYRLQQRILRNTFLTRKMTALVYGEWPDKTKNIKPFFTASYSENDKLPVSKRSLGEVINLAFVGTLTKNKSPLTSLEVLRELTDKGINATLTYCGEGPESIEIGQKIQDYMLNDKVKLLGNVNAEKVKEVLREAHFLVFISRSEGWPKAVSEAMWWGCIPVTTPVSCVPWMLGNGSRGELVNGEIKEITSLIEEYVSKQNQFDSKSDKAMIWSREYTLERFESEIKQLF